MDTTSHKQEAKKARRAARQKALAERMEAMEQRHPHSKRRAGLAVLIAILLLTIDQVIKFAVKTNMMLGETIRITDWFYIYFTENPGMAFGWEIFDKTFLTLFRIVASVLIAWLIIKATKRSYPTSFIVCLTAIFAGAVGNIFDSLFYGVIFDHSYGQVATLFPEGGGYAGWLEGKVVDMFYFPIINTYWPSWMPWVGGEEFIFFRPIFNFADACISVGVILLFICFPHSFTHLLGGYEKKATEQPQDDEPTA